ncbi:hypothetical protein GCM10010387_33400 [Streptomyces inusitatus]|uniref:Chitin-binding type-3 domain-containing protein n=1 Tax=Streptomyces inusitatus TaxID=68221 RepID=A0A918QAD1_9ACTN|nr:hypothetical protein GCM10010387_33400 [Streptomyces inusitatus]
MHLRTRLFRWTSVVLGALLFAVLGAGTAFAALPIGESRTGKATWYSDAGYGACGTPIDASTQDLVAISHRWWTAANPNNDELCAGISVEVTYNGRTITVPVKDKCPSCGPEHIDLSRTAFQKLAATDLGVINGITWKFVRAGGGGACSTAPAWTAGTWYPAGTVVVYAGRHYIAEHGNPGYDPVISTWYWDPYTCR